MTGFRPAAEAPGARSARLTRRSLGWLSGSGTALIGLCVLGFRAMSVLDDRADRAREPACRDHPSTVHWEHGYDALLPVGSAAVALTGVVLSVAVLVSKASAWWSRVLSSVTLVVGCLALLLSVLAVHDFYAYPGGDVSTVSSSPCGSG